MIQSAFHRTGDHSRVESCPSPRFASARRSGFPLLRASTRTPPFVRLLPLRYDREHDPIRKVGSSLTPAGRAGARSRPTTMNRRGPRVTFTTQENDGQVCRRSGSRRPYCYGRAGERAVRVTTFPILADGFHRRHGSRAPSGGIFPVKDESPYSTLSRASLGHRLRAKEYGERSHATNQPKIRPTFRVPRRIRTCDRIEMLSVVHHSFARVRIAPRHARVEPARPSSFLRRRVAASGSRRLFDCPLRSSAAAFAVGSPLTREGGDRRRPFDGWRR
jgi:hypothetical protein